MNLASGRISHVLVQSNNHYGSEPLVTLFGGDYHPEYYHSRQQYDSCRGIALFYCTFNARDRVTTVSTDHTTHQLPLWPQIIDGGSTGSRLHVFESVDHALLRRGSARADAPLSAFASLHGEPVNASAVAEHLMPAFQYAAEVIPEQYHASTRVLYQATAGMRLLTEEQQAQVYDAMYTGLLENDRFVFAGLQRSDIATLSGDLEGFYGAVAANYLKGTIDVDLRLLGPDHGPIGALDMGGSSTQIVFLPDRKHASSAESCASVDNAPAESPTTSHAAAQDEMPSRLQGHDFFATSYLSYGVDQFRERLWNTLVEEHRQQVQRSMAEGDLECDAKLIANPCGFAGHQSEWQGYVLLGTGRTGACIERVQQLIPHPHPNGDLAMNVLEPTLGKHVGGVEHPPVRGKFFAMSLYFFSLDSLRELSHPSKEAHEALSRSWPNPSIEELHNALDGLCSRPWKGDLEDIQHNAHQFTRAEVLPHRCIEAVYMVTLLRDGFGFAPESRDITFAFLVDGSEVEWTLGMALVLRADQKSTSTTVHLVEEGFATTAEDSRRSSLIQRLARDYFASLSPLDYV